MQKIIFLIGIIQIFITSIKCNPLNFTHRIKMSISIDNQPRSALYIGLWRDEPNKQAVDNFLSLCLGYGNVQLESGQVFHIKGHKIYKIYTNNFLVAGDISPNYDQNGKQTIFRENDGKTKDWEYKSKSYHHQFNTYVVEPGVLALDAEYENGELWSEFRMFIKGYDIVTNYKHQVFGQIYKNFPFVKFIEKTAGQDNGVPKRDVVISECELYDEEEENINFDQSYLDDSD